MILVFATETDVHFKAVENELINSGVEYVVFDSRQFPFDVQLSYSLNQDGIRTHLIFQDRVIDVRDITAVWYRRIMFSKMPKHIHKDAHFYVREESMSALQALKKVMPQVFWLGDSNTVMLATPKIHQLLVAQELGLLVPSTYIGNNTSEILEFNDQFSDICIKGVQETHSRRKIPFSKKVKLWLKGQLDEYMQVHAQATWNEGTELLNGRSLRVSSEYIRQNINRATYCPLTYQQYIEKAFELRITVVGDKLFACAIYSQESEKARDDFRSEDYKKLRHETYNLPEDIQNKVKLLMQKLGFNFGCVDMIVTPEGEYIFLEVNSDGQWLWIEEMTGMPIAKAIADSLCAPAKKAEESLLYQ